MKRTLNVTAYNNIYDNSLLPIVWQKFGKYPLLFQHGNANMHKEMVYSVWCGRLSCTEPLPQPVPIPLKGTGAPTVTHASQTARSGEEPFQDTHFCRFRESGDNMMDRGSGERSVKEKGWSERERAAPCPPPPERITAAFNSINLQVTETPGSSDVNTGSTSVQMCGRIFFRGHPGSLRVKAPTLCPFPPFPGISLLTAIT